MVTVAVVDPVLRCASFHDNAQKVLQLLSIGESTDVLAPSPLARVVEQVLRTDAVVKTILPKSVCLKSPHKSSAFFQMKFANDAADPFSSAIFVPMLNALLLRDFAYSFSPITGRESVIAVIAALTFVRLLNQRLRTIQVLVVSDRELEVAGAPMSDLADIPRETLFQLNLRRIEMQHEI
jgi:hypothetical protein